MIQNTIFFNVEGMSCGHCSASVTKALLELKAVVTVDVDLKGKKVSVVYNGEEIEETALKAAIEDAGYDVV